MASFAHHLRQIRRVADWLQDQAATRELRNLRQKYSPLVAKAEQQKNWDERDRLLADWSSESDVILHLVYERKGERLTAKARKYGITVPRQPSSDGEESQDWYLSNVYGFWLPSPQLQQRLRREIRAERRASDDELRKWATLGFAFLGFMLGLASILAKQKQPDPCQRNYYRNDSGECIFGLSGQPSKKGSSVQGTPILGPAEKPSPAHRSTGPGS